MTSASDGFATGSLLERTFSLDVIDGAQSLVVALAFKDALASALASSPIVNDLDLEVESPDGALYLGNVYSNGFSVTGGAADAVNNLELVRIEPPLPSGRWTLRVRPASVFVGPQPFALIASGRACRGAGVFATPPVVVESACGVVSISAPSTGGTLPVTYSIYAGDGPGMEDFGAPLASGQLHARAVERPASRQRCYVVEALDFCGDTSRSAETCVTLSTPCDAGTPLLFVTKTPADAVLTWDDPAGLREIVRFPVASAVRNAPAIATSAIGTWSEPMPPDGLTFYVVR